MKNNSDMCYYCIWCISNASCTVFTYFLAHFYFIKHPSSRVFLLVLTVKSTWFFILVSQGQGTKSEGLSELIETLLSSQTVLHALILHCEGQSHSCMKEHPLFWKAHTITAFFFCAKYGNFWLCNLHCIVQVLCIFSKFWSLVFIYWQCYCFITKPMDHDENVLFAGIYLTQKCGTKCVTVSPSPLATPLTTAPALQGKWRRSLTPRFLTVYPIRLDLQMN